MRVVAVGTDAVGFLAIGQQATGVIAIGQLAIGVVAVGQLSRGVIAIGQLTAGLFSFGQVSIGGVWSGGMVSLAPTAGFALLPGGLVGRWVPWRRASCRAPRSRGRWMAIRAVLALGCLAAIIALSIVPLVHDLFGDGGVFAEPPVVLR